MGLQFMQEYENQRLQNRPITKSRPKWEYGEYLHFNDALDAAIPMGYEQHRVQIRRIFDESGMRFLIEPYEENCECAKVIQFRG